MRKPKHEEDHIERLHGKREKLREKEAQSAISFCIYSSPGTKQMIEVVLSNIPGPHNDSMENYGVQMWVRTKVQDIIYSTIAGISSLLSYSTCIPVIIVLRQAVPLCPAQTPEPQTCEHNCMVVVLCHWVLGWLATQQSNTRKWLNSKTEVLP